jgi:methylase of polypeptide subunit release factors
MLFEVNRAYGQAVQELMRQAGYADVQLCQDQYGNDRIVKGRKT